MMIAVHLNIIIYINHIFKIVYTQAHIEYLDLG